MIHILDHLTAKLRLPRTSLLVLPCRGQLAAGPYYPVLKRALDQFLGDGTPRPETSTTDVLGGRFSMLADQEKTDPLA
jgi:hypothetical protein